MNPISRRDVVRRIAWILGGAMIGSDLILSGQTISGIKLAEGFTDQDRALLDEIGETIIPARDIPGAKAVGIGAFMIVMVTDCYTDEQHAAFKAGLGQIDEAARAKFGRPFMECSPTERTALASALDADRQTDPTHYFRMMKELTILGYFSSEVGCTQAFHYMEVPGALDGNRFYQQGEILSI